VGHDRLHTMNAYTLEKSRFAIAWKTCGDGVLLALVISGLLNALDGSCAKIGLGPVWSGVLFFAALGGGFFLLGLPWDYYASFVLEEKFGFNRSNVKTWIMDQVKGAGVSLVLLVLVLAPLLWFVQRFPTTWWLWAFGFVSLVQLVLVVLYPVLIAPLFNVFEPLHDEALAEKVESLARKVGVNPRGIFQMDAGRRSGHSNAYFTGLGKTKRVVLFDTLMDSHSHEEILGVLAHELGHYKLKHILKSYLLGQGVMLVGFSLTYLLMNWNLMQETFGFDASRPYLGFFIMGVFWQRAAFFMGPCFAALSRRFERQADAFAANLQGGPGSLITALKRLAAENLANLTPHSWYAWFHYSHPPLVERIRLLQTYGK
jgi:STE24 endopeptidase